MSPLNFVRLLWGGVDEVKYALLVSPVVGDGVPITRLDKTYRLHDPIADLLTGLVYSDDGICLRTEQDELLPPV